MPLTAIQEKVFRLLREHRNPDSHVAGASALHAGAFRFFPAEPDATLGYRLHQADLAVNKILAAAGRQVARDYLDLMFLHETYLAIGALAWAATGKDPGLSPLFILNELVRSNRYRPEDFAPLHLVHPVSLPELKQTFLRAITEAETLINRLPQIEVGCLYLDAGGRPVTPDPDAPAFAGLIRHYGTLRGSWPRVIAGDNPS